MPRLGRDSIARLKTGVPIKKSLQFPDYLKRQRVKPNAADRGFSPTLSFEQVIVYSNRILKLLFFFLNQVD